MDVIEKTDAFIQLWLLGMLEMDLVCDRKLEINPK